MSKLSKKFRQLRLVKFLMLCRKNVFLRFKKYPEYRNKVRYFKWLFKFKLYPRYRAINSYIKKDFDNISLFRPECTFTEFDLGVTATNKVDKETVFIQIVTKEHFDKQGKDIYNLRVDSFRLKKKIYGIVRKDIAKHDSSKLNDLVKVLELDDKNPKFTLFISKFIKCNGLFKLIESTRLTEKEKIYLITQIDFYKSCFNRCNLLWLDATPHNIIVMDNSLKIAPIDFATRTIASEEETINSNEKSARKLIDYINNGVYQY